MNIIPHPASFPDIVSDTSAKYFQDGSLSDLPPFNSRREAQEAVDDTKYNGGKSREHSAYWRRGVYKLHDKQAYKLLDYDSFKAMALKELSLEESYATRLVNATRVERKLAEVIPHFERVNLSEHQLYVLYRVWREHSLKDAVRVYEEAHAKRSEERGKPTPPTAKLLTSVAVDMGLRAKPTAVYSQPVWNNSSFKEVGEPDNSTVLKEIECSTQAQEQCSEQGTYSIYNPSPLTLTGNLDADFQALLAKHGDTALHNLFYEWEEQSEFCPKRTARVMDCSEDGVIKILVSTNAGTAHAIIHEGELAKFGYYYHGDQEDIPDAPDVPALRLVRFEEGAG